MQFVLDDVVRDIALGHEHYDHAYEHQRGCNEQEELPTQGKRQLQPGNAAHEHEKVLYYAWTGRVGWRDVPSGAVAWSGSAMSTLFDRATGALRKLSSRPLLGVTLACVTLLWLAQGLTGVLTLSALQRQIVDATAARVEVSARQSAIVIENGVR